MSVMINISDQLEPGLPDLVNVMVTCPRCEERSASACRMGHIILWNCKRASCTGKGMEVSGQGYTPEKATERPEFVPRPIPSAMCGYPGVEIRQLLGFDGEYIGDQSRSPGKHIRTWMFRDRVPYSYLPPVDGLEYGFPLWLVEDIRSAETLATYGCPAVALLGTSIKERFIQEELLPWLTRNRTPKVLVALDPDATMLAMKQAQVLQRAIAHRTLTEPFLGCRVQWVSLRQDIKDMDDETVKQHILCYARSEP